MGGNYDVIIVGAGVIGTALAHTLSNYSDIKRILLIEKYDGPAKLNSNSRNNSQTLHFGDIEANYSMAKARETKSAAEMLLNYTNGLPPRRRTRIIARCQKMVLAVGDEEVEFLRSRYDKKFMRMFPRLRVIGRSAISRVEPYVTIGREKSESILAAYSEYGYMMDFGELSKSFLEKAGAAPSGIRASFGEWVTGIRHGGGGYRVSTNKGAYTADFVVFAAGTYSLYFAKSLGYGENLSIVPVLGAFYHSRKVLNGKVYTLQRGNIPFLSVHGDPDMNHRDRTRYGPTITLYPFLERGRPSTAIDHLRSIGIDLGTARSYARMLVNRDLSSTFLRHISYSLPVFGKGKFVEREIRRIVPSMPASGIRLESGSGGIRPQIIDKDRGEIRLGEGKIGGDGIIFNIAPSPGASSCMRIALEDALDIAGQLGAHFDKAAFHSDYVHPPGK